MKTYTYVLIRDGQVIDQTNIDEKNPDLAYDIMVRDENRINPSDCFVELLEEGDDEE